MKKPYEYEYSKVEKFYKYGYFRIEKLYKYKYFIIKKFDRDIQYRYNFKYLLIMDKFLKVYK